MTVLVGAQAAAAVFVGAAAAASAWLGNVQVWPVQTAPEVLAAYPSCQGGGCGTGGGRGGTVIEVTNLANSGTGSLRACIQASGARTCVFRVGGTIPLSSTLSINNANLTIAGQTAPGGGIQLDGRALDGAGAGIFQINTHDVILRYVRVRKGWSTYCYNNPNPGCGFGISMITPVGSTVDVYNIVIDHNSVEWNTDEGIEVWDNSNSAVVRGAITISWNIEAWPLDNHATCYMNGAQAAADTSGMLNIDMHHNLCAFAGNRMPAIGAKSGRFVNNITYAWYGASISMAIAGATWDGINNLYKRGSGVSRHPFSIYDSSTFPTDATWYLSGNIGPQQPNPSGDQWLLATMLSGYQGSETGAVPTQFRRSSALTNTAFPIAAEPAAGLEASLLPVVGASRRLACDGTWIAARDAVDSLVVTNYNAGTGGLINNESAAGGFPTLAAGTPCPDADHDGMPDQWETARGLNPNNAADRNTVDQVGFTMLERYLAGP